jgi:DNA processing protein
VLAHGLDKIYPNQHRRLAINILKQNGGLITECRQNTLTMPFQFPKRNRIVAGMSDATIVIESQVEGGSMITAKLARGYDREVFAVPGSPFDPRCQGTNRLIKDGANIITEVEDVLNATTQKNYYFKKTTQISQIKKEYNFSNDQVFNAREEILQNLNSDPTNIDLLISELQIPINLFNTAVMELEIDNKVSVNYGKIVKLMEG